MRKALFVLAIFLVPSPAPSCSLCGTLSRSMSLAFEYEQAGVIAYGTIANPKLNANGRGTTEFHIERVLKNDPAFPKEKMLLLAQYLPILDAKSPTKWVMFIRDPKKSVQPYFGKDLASVAVLDFVAELHVRREDPSAMLLYAAKHFDHADQNIADEAFMLFAKADDKLIAQTAKKLSPVNLRKLIKDGALEPERMSMFAYLLGACGNADDVEVLRALLKNPSPRMYKSFEGVLAGYITLRPEEGWTVAKEMLKDDKKSFLLRFATLRTMRFFYNARPEEAGPRVLANLQLALGHADIADIAIQDLRRWKRWEFTKEVLACWDRPSYQSAIIKQNIVRYALVCPSPESREFVERARRQDPELVRNMEQELK